MSIFNGGIFGSGSGSTSISGRSYNKFDFFFTGDSFTYAGETFINGVYLRLTGNKSMTGLSAGWYYFKAASLASNGFADASSEIVANTQAYTPTPTYSSTELGYYMTGDSTSRILGIVYFNGTNILEAIPYGDGANKNDNLWVSQTDSVTKSTVNSRLQMTAAFDRSRGTDVTCVDNGSGTTDATGFRATANSPQKININGNLLLTATNSGSTVYIACNKNGSLFKNLDRLEVNGTSTEVSHIVAFNVNDIASIGDYYTFYIVSVTSAVAQLRNITVTCEVL